MTLEGLKYLLVGGLGALVLAALGSGIDDLLARRHRERVRRQYRR